MEKHKVLDQMLSELEEFLKILDKENLSSTAIVRKCLLTELLQTYMKSDGCDEEYIYMNKVIISGENQEKLVFERDDHSDSLTNGNLGKHSPAPQKSLPDLPHPRPCSDREPLPAPKLESLEGYYEEAQPYDTATNDIGCFGRLIISGARTHIEAADGVIYATISREDGEAVSSSYESYDEEEVTKGKSTTHQWPSTEASIELMKDVRICAFLWRKKWLGQWAKQLCVIRENRLLCYKSSKDQSPQLDVSLVGCSVVYKEKQVKKKEHNLKIIPLTGDVIVLGLQSKEQTEQWLKAIQEITKKQLEIPDGSHYTSDSPRLRCTKVDVHERHSIASESGSSTDSHAETPEIKDVKKKYGAGLKLSNFMNIGKKKCSSLESPEKCVDTSGYMNVLVNSQWRTRWCLIKNGQLYFYQDKSKNKAVHQPLSLGGCVVVPDPSPEHLYSFRILHEGEQRATLEAKSSDEMGHWLGLLLSESGSKTDPEELTYDYVDSERISCIVNAAKNSLNLMQRKYSEPNTYTDNLPAIQNDSDDIYDDVDVPEHMQENAVDSWSPEQEMDRVYLDLIPVKSFLHPSPGWPSPGVSPVLGRASCQALDSEREGDSQTLEGTSKAFQQRTDSELPPARTNIKTQTSTPEMDVDQASPKTTINIQSQHQKIFFPSTDPHRKSTASPQAVRVTSEMPDRPKLSAAGSIETRLGKGRTEAEIRRFTDERDRLEREKEQIRNSLALLRKHKRELKEDISSSNDAGGLAALEHMLREMEEDCKQKEKQRVDLELNLMEVKESLKKAESGPVTLGTAVDSSLLETASSRLPEPKAATYTAPATPNNGEVSPVNCATNLKNRPLSVMAASKGNVLQKAKEWEKKATG
ncbi:actin filament-associated protein 1-like 2 isoform X1 [Acipenser oxyrinchus oxyrinchus]|uniref:Actin filament-associated protein 1-like 2 n=1 Tax=Acipenser oxyrinchus oxyrinchus TaxID=40147 RepID=A0AAD8G7A8_ACIOX|nr:actin filament-associated protein 1-like 2 isoform X1 [Acipenser oxyrinchus oxyrinchus]